MAAKFTYTDSEVSEIVAKYGAGETLEALADLYNKSVQSIRMKLVKLGVYQAKTRAKSAGKSAAAKPETADPKPKLTAKQAAKANLELFDLMMFEFGPAPF
jgi:Zn-dependent peptidase ImmA (M78 family)